MTRLARIDMLEKAVGQACRIGKIGTDQGHLCVFDRDQVPKYLLHDDCPELCAVVTELQRRGTL